MITEKLGKWSYLVEMLKSAGPEGLTFGEICERWKWQYNDALPQRTFYHLREYIADFSGIEIKCNRRAGKFYIDEENADPESKTAWMINAFSIGQLQELKKGSLSGRISIEDVPSGQTWLMQIVSAMKENRKIILEYLKYGAKEADVRHLRPYGVFEEQRRWYVTGYSEEKKTTRTYSMDRIKNIKLTDEHFKMPAGYSLDDVMAESFGAFIPSPDEKAKKIIFRTTARDAAYLRDLPIHVSQKEMRGGKYASDAMPYVFQVRVFPSYDFYQKLMSLEPSIEVLEPQEVRDEMASRLSESMKLYKSNNPKIK